MRNKITINDIDLIMLSKHKTLLEVYISLLIMSMDEFYIQFPSFDFLKGRLGFKTRSGVWKALKKLERMRLIRILNNKILINNKGLYND